MTGKPPHVLLEQAILNEHWPAHPRSFRNHEPGIKVRVRLIWEKDGEEYVRGLARRWDADHVYVEIDDRRRHALGVWVKPADVYRNSSA
ncbi:hypothetical protein [Phytoactinopolyspora halotolerans]|uniref:Uncharacterized protein n=1 Tax=Phytoactinopolyspora halotolerans TaxID=1981512 RepID=A0A6L9S824_9ACTN|nr:hypothetical protein [Phytoactinopolyspora halotolerans]NEE01153.1 hypothetical protein [Phytoactinopolyspora halotolerans]